MDNKTSEVAQILKGLSMQDFLAFGVQDFAYIREVETEEGVSYAVCGADGNMLSVAEERIDAESMVSSQDMKLITLQ